MSKLSKVAGTILGSTALAAVPATSEADVEPLNNAFPGEPATVGATLNGFVASSGTDSIDLYSYTGLPPGGAFDLQAEYVCCAPETGVLHAGRYTSQTTVVDSVNLGTHDVRHLTGTVPTSGSLSFGLTVTGSTSSESYRVTLNLNQTAVPEPASLVLLASGLAGLHIARRRKRG